MRWIVGTIVHLKERLLMFNEQQFINKRFNRQSQQITINW